MKTVFSAIMKRSRSYAAQPLFTFFRDERIDPVQRFAFCPYVAFFALSFGDINRHVLRDDTSSDAYQQMINVHTEEDDHHWQWFLEDVAKLGFDQSMSSMDWLSLLWHEQTAPTRLITYNLVSLLRPLESVLRLVVMESIEETGNVFFGALAQAADEFQRKTGTELRFFGSYHLDKESGHLVGSDHRNLAAIELSDAQRAEGLRLVDQVFGWFEAWSGDILSYLEGRSAPAGEHRLTPL